MTTLMRLTSEILTCHISTSLRLPVIHWKNHHTTLTPGLTRLIQCKLEQLFNRSTHDRSSPSPRRIWTRVLQSFAVDPFFFNDHTEGQAYLASRAPLTGVNSLYMSPGSFEHGGIGNMTEAIVNIDPLLCSIFWSTLNETNSPARAIQAFRTTQYRMIYYDLVRSFQEPTMIDVDELTTVIAPTTKIGYISVVGIIVAHVTILVLVAALFFQQTQWSFLENAWSATAQVATNEDAQIVLGASSAMTDKEILPWI